MQCPKLLLQTPTLRGNHSPAASSVFCWPIPTAKVHLKTGRGRLKLSADKNKQHHCCVVSKQGDFVSDQNGGGGFRSQWEDLSQKASVWQRAVREQFREGVVTLTRELGGEEVASGDHGSEKRKTAQEEERNVPQGVGKEAVGGAGATLVGQASPALKEEVPATWWGPSMQRWDVPWTWETTFGTVLAVMCITPFVVQVVAPPVRQLCHSLAPGWGIPVGPTSFHLTEGVAELDLRSLLIEQVIGTAAGLSVVGSVVWANLPLPEGWFKTETRDPLKPPTGWLLCTALGLFSALSVFGIVTFATWLAAGCQFPPRDPTDVTVHLLRMIAEAPANALWAVLIGGICAPLLEEILFRGFLMTSLTRYMPTPAAILASSAAFAALHMTTANLWQRMVVGTILGIAYAQSRNLLAPMLIHSLWNSCLILVVLVLRLMGYNIVQTFG